MKNLPTKMKVFAYIFIGMLLIINLNALYEGYLALTTIITNGFSNFFTNLPLMLHSLSLIILLMGALFSLNRNSIKATCHSFLITSIVSSSIFLTALILNILNLTFVHGWVFNFNSNFYGKIYSYMCLDIFYITILVMFIVLYKNLIESFDEEENDFINDKPYSFGRMVYYTFVVTFALTLASFTFKATYVYKDNYIEPYWYGMIPVLFLLTLPFGSLVFYFIYKINNKKNFWLLSLVILGGSLFICCLWTFIVYLIEPRFIYLSMQALFPLGLAIKIPLAPLFAIVFMVVVLLIACIKYIRRYKNVGTENEEANIQKAKEH